MKKIGLGVLTLAIALSFTACSKDSKKSSTNITPIPTAPNNGYGGYYGNYPGYNSNPDCGTRYQYVNNTNNPQCIDTQNNNAVIDINNCQCYWLNPGYPVSGGYNDWNSAYNYGSGYGAGYPIYYPPYQGGAGFVGYVNFDPYQMNTYFGYAPSIYGYAGGSPVYQGCQVGTGQCNCVPYIGTQQIGYCAN